MAHETSITLFLVNQNTGSIGKSRPEFSGVGSQEYCAGAVGPVYSFLSHIQRVGCSNPPRFIRLEEVNTDL